MIPFPVAVLLRAGDWSVCSPILEDVKGLHPLEPHMRSVGVVLDSVLICQWQAFSSHVEHCEYQELNSEPDIERLSERLLSR